MENKSWYLSKTIWGAVIMLIALILNQFGIVVSAEEQASIVDSIVASTDTILALAGFILTIVGRFKAETPLK